MTRRTVVQHSRTGIVGIEAGPTAGSSMSSWRADDPGGELLESERVRGEFSTVAWGRSRTPRMAVRDGASVLWAGGVEATVDIDGRWADDPTGSAHG